MKVTEQAIREAMKLAPGVAVTLGTLDEALRTRTRGIRGRGGIPA